MRWLFVVLIALLLVTDFTGVNPGLGPGLSVKNAMLYAAVMVLACGCRHCTWPGPPGSVTQS
jgi:hypothetical protein